MITRSEFIQEFSTQLKIQRSYLRDHFPAKHKLHNKLMKRFDERAYEMERTLHWMLWIPFKPVVRVRFRTLWCMNVKVFFSSRMDDRLSNTAATYIHDALVAVREKYDLKA